MPALVVSPFTERASVSDVLYDHTSIIKTILLRFCKTNGQIPDMGARVRHANHLGSTLALAKARPPTPLKAFREAVDRITSWRADVFRSRVLMEALTTPADPTDLSDCSNRCWQLSENCAPVAYPRASPNVA